LGVAFGEVADVDDGVEALKGGVVVGDDEESGIGVARLFDDEIQDASGGCGVEVAGRFVAEDEVRSGGKGAADGDALAFTLREAGGLAVEEVRDACLFDEVHGVGFKFTRIDGGAGGDVVMEQDVVAG
jgi:hypothetical protein